MSHGHHGCEHEHHNHSHTPPLTTNAQQSLYEWIDVPKVRCLNAVSKNTSSMTAAFIKDQTEKYNISRYIESDADCQMLLHIPFTTTCKLYSLILRSGKGDAPFTSCIRHIKLYKNLNKNLDFDTVSSLEADNVFEFPEGVGVHLHPASDNDSQLEERDGSSFVEHFLPRHVFNNCHSLTIFIEDNSSGDEDEVTQLCYVEVRGESTGMKPSNATVPLMTVYEAAPNPADHVKLESENERFQLGM